MSCHADGERFVVEVADEGPGIWLRQNSPGIGHGLAMVGAVAHALNIAPGADGRGTAVTTVFGPVPPPAASPGVEMLCGLALETVAHVSNVDLVHEGVLRRVAAEVANDPALTAWLRAAVPRRSPARQRGRRRATAARAWSSPTPPSRARPADRGAPQPYVVGRGRTREIERNTSGNLGPRGPRGSTSVTARGGHRHLRRRGTL